MKRGDTVAWLELCDGGTDLFDNAGDVVALVCAVEFRVDGWPFPVLGVGARDMDFREDFVGFGGRDRDVVECDAEGVVDERFEHGTRLR